MTNPLPEPAANAKFDYDRFFVNQKHMTLGKSKYYVYDEAGAPLFYVERPVMRLFGRRGNITIFDDDSARTPVLELRQEQRYEFLRRDYTLVDAASGESLGRLLRSNWRSLFRRAWSVLGPDGAEVARAREDSALFAFLRRAIDFVPYVGILGFALMRTNFHIFALQPDGGELKVGEFNRKLSFGDKYVLDLEEDQARRLDRRVALALGILLDTAEAR